MDFSEGTATAGVGLLSGIIAAFGAAFHFGGRLVRIETLLKKLDERLDRLETRINEHLDRGK